MHLDRLIMILETVAVAGRPISAMELQQTTGLPRPTCYRLLQTLTEQRLLDEPDEGGRYLIGERLVRIALLGQADADVRKAAAPALKEASVDLGEAVFLSRFRSKGVEIVQVETPADPARSYVHPGLGFRPMHACSCSKAIAAFAEEDFREDIISRAMRAYTDHTKTTAETLRAEFANIQAIGYAECVEEIELGVSSVAAPVRIGNVGVIYSFGATGSVLRFTKAKRASIGGRMQDLAAQVSGAIQLSGAAPAEALSEASAQP
jgi:IclR family acetate operon transcriptional repressor